MRKNGVLEEGGGAVITCTAPSLTTVRRAIVRCFSPSVAVVEDSLTTRIFHWLSVFKDVLGVEWSLKTL